MKLKTLCLIVWGCLGALCGVALCRFLFFVRPIRLDTICVSVNRDADTSLEEVVSEAIDTAGRAGCQVRLSFGAYAVLVSPGAKHGQIMQRCIDAQSAWFTSLIEAQAEKDRLESADEILRAAVESESQPSTSV